MLRSFVDLEAAFVKVHGNKEEGSVATAAAPTTYRGPMAAFNVDPNALDWQFPPVGFKTFCEHKDHMNLLPKGWKPGEEGALSHKQMRDCIEFLGDDPKCMFDPNVRKYTFGGLLWAKGCLDGDSLLFDEVSKQSYTIREIYEKNLIISVKVYDEQTGAILIKPVARVFSKGIMPRLKIKLKSGKELIVSPEHQFFDGSKWVKAGDLIHAKTKQIAYIATNRPK